MNNIVVISGVTVSILVVILLFKLNKTKIEYDNKLLVLNRKVRDLTNLVDLSNTKNNLLNNEVNNQEVIKNSNEGNNSNVEPSGIDSQYQNFVQNNGNFFDNLDNFEAPIPEDIKNDIDNLVNVECLEETELMNALNEVENEITPPTLANYDGEVSSEPQPESIPSGDLEEDILVEEQVNENTNYVNEESEFVEQVYEETEPVVSVEDNLNLNESEEILNVDINQVNLYKEEITEVSLENLENVTEEVAVKVKEPVEDISPTPEQKNNINFDDLENLSVKSLQDICREYKLKVKGRKDELIERIKEYLSVDKL
jgi:hypothetical protein